MPTPPLIEHFAVLKDPRIDRTKQHLLLDIVVIVDIVVIAFCTVLCGAEGWEDMETFGHAKKEWLQERLGLELPHGIPGDDTFRRLFARLDPEEFGRCFLSFAQSLHTHTQGEVIALDGKTLRHSFVAARDVPKAICGGESRATRRCLPRPSIQGRRGSRSASVIRACS